MSEQPTPDEVVAQAEAVVESAASAPAEATGTTEARRGMESDEAAEETRDWETVAAERTSTTKTAWTVTGHWPGSWGSRPW